MPDNSYKSDLEAAMARSRALEAENRKLREQLEDNKAPATPKAHHSAWVLVLVAFALVSFGLLGFLIPVAGPRGAMVALALISSIGIPLLVVRKQLHVCQPNEALVIFGRAYAGGDYRVVFAGSRVLLVPVIERLERIDLSAMPIEAEVRHAYSKGGRTVRVALSGAVKVSSAPHVIGNAIERFLGRDIGEIVRVARETLEGCLRTILALMTLEELQQDRLMLVQRLREELDGDLDKLGLEIDALSVQEIEPES